MFFIVVGLVITMGVLFFLWKEQEKSSRHPLLVKAKGLPLLGNLLDFPPNCDGLAIFNSYIKKYGPFIELNLGTKRALLIADLAVGRDILSKRPKKFTRGRMHEYATTVLHTEPGLFFAEGHLWTRMRKSSSSAFAKLNLSNQFSKIVHEVNYWIEGFSHQINEDPAEIIDLKKEALSLTVRVINIVAFGLDSTNPICKYFFSDEFKQDIHDGFTFFGESGLWVYPRWLWKYSSKYALEVKAIQALDRVISHCQKIIDMKRQAILEASKNGECNSLQYSSMIDSFLYHGIHSTEKALTDHEIITNVQGFYAAGSDSTSIVTTWMAFYLSQYPAYQKKIREEIKEKLFHNQSKSQALVDEITLDKLMDLPMTTSFVKETLRLKGAAPVLLFEVGEEGKLSNGIPVYPNEIIWVYGEGIQCDEKIFQDPFQFYPERWLTTNQECLSKMESAFLAFGAGPRVCPGALLAMHEMILAVGLLAYHFQVELCCPVEDVKRINHFLFQASQMPVRFHPVKE